MTLAKAVGEYDTVQAWIEDYRRHWGPDADFQGRLQTLQRFCEFVGKDPDTMIQECLRAVDAGFRIRPKRRRFYMAKIAEFEAQGSNGGRRAGNIVRSFLIHNGVALSADVAR
jgi:hypothetical protein